MENKKIVLEKHKIIAFVSDSVYPFNKGGKEKRLHEISRRLVSEEREVHIYTMQWWEGPKVVQFEGVYHHAICKLHPLYHGDRRSISEALWFSLSVFKLVFARFDVLDVDHMPVFPLFAARLVTWLRRKELYATWHEVWGREYWKEYLRGTTGLLGALAEWLSFKMPNVIIANSAHTARRLEAAGVRCRIETVTIGVDVQGIYSANPAEEKCDIIYVGRLLSHKCVDLLVGAIKVVKESYPEIKVIIVGEGPEKKGLLTLVSDLGLDENIRLIGDVEQSDTLYGLMKSSKMLVLPSIREGFGLVVVEANAAGIPVITTNHTDNAAKDLIVEGVNGLLTYPAVEDIAKNIIQLLRSHEQMRPQENIEKYDWSIIVKKLEKIYLNS